MGGCLASFLRAADAFYEISIEFWYFCRVLLLRQYHSLPSCYVPCFFSGGDVKGGGGKETHAEDEFTPASAGDGMQEKVHS